MGMGGGGITSPRLKALGRLDWFQDTTAHGICVLLHLNITPLWFTMLQRVMATASVLIRGMTCTFVGSLDGSCPGGYCDRARSQMNPRLPASRHSENRSLQSLPSSTMAKAPRVTFQGRSGLPQRNPCSQIVAYTHPPRTVPGNGTATAPKYP